MNTEHGVLSKVTAYSKQLSPVSILALRELVGRAIHTVYSPCLQVHQRHLTSPSLSIPISDETADGWVHRYVVVTCEWFETPEASIDYWQMLVNVGAKPNDIEKSPSLGLIAPCTVHMYGHNSPIQKIDIYAYFWPATEPSNGEIVTYDRAIRFERADGAAFCISCQLDGPGIATEVHFSDDEETISSLLNGSKVRMSIA